MLQRIYHSLLHVVTIATTIIGRYDINADRNWPHQRLDAFAAAMAELPLPWRALAAVRVLPGWLKDGLYKPIARNRYRIFGRYETCLIPDAALRARFLPGGG